MSFLTKTKTPAKKVAKSEKKLYKDYFDIQKNAPRRKGAVATTESGISYKLIQLSPLVWKKK